MGKGQGLPVVRAGRGVGWRCLFGVWLLIGAHAAHASEWLAIPADELALTAEPKAPLAPAIFLYREIERDDIAGVEDVHERIKILTEAGRRYGDVEIQFNGVGERIANIEARTIRPDGTVVPFAGEVFEKTLVKARGVKYLTRTFTLPDVQVGSIVEYRYRRRLPFGFVFDSRWILNEDLFTRHARFSLRTNNQLSLSWSWPVGLPPGTEPPVATRGIVRLETHDVPAFVTEPYMPPATTLKQRVDFVYSSGRIDKDSAAFWKRYLLQRAAEVERFVDHRGAMQKAIAEIVAPDDPPELRLRKIYARVQRLENLSFGRERTQAEYEREKIEYIRDAADVWERGRGDGQQLTYLFLALARAAGLDADAVDVSTRDRYFFSPELRNPAQLNTNVVLVRVGATDYYLDPGTAFAPFGLLPWNETGVRGLVLDPDALTWITTPVPPAAESRVERVADFRLTPEGSLDGRVTVTYSGLEALTRRIDQRHSDAAARRAYLEGELASAVPVGIDATLVNAPDWESSAPTLVAQFDVRIGGWATPAGGRLLLPSIPFGAEERQMFTHATRVHPIYFDFPGQHDDVVGIALPAGWRPAGVPAPVDVDKQAVSYALRVDAAGDTLRATRRLTIGGMLLTVRSYDALREFYQSVRTADEQQIVLVRGAAPHAR